MRSLYPKITKQLSMGAIILGLSLPALAESPKFDVSGQWNLRYENLTNPFFPTTDERFHQHNQRLSSKLQVKGVMTWSRFELVGELGDSRVYLDNDDPTLGRSQVNTLEPVQLHVSWLGEANTNSDLSMKKTSVGRFLLDHGSRRLIASAYFRNALNTFDGVVSDWQWQDWNVRAVYLRPVTRLPGDAASIDSNERALDKSYSERQLYGFYAYSQNKTWQLQSYWLDEDDGPDLNTANRQFLTVSAHYTLPNTSDWRADAEVILQSGTRHQTSSPSDTTEIDQRAWLFHGAIGQMITDNTSLQAVADIISGDNDSSDGTNRNFDGLYGVRRFDFGPTEVYRTLPRRNLVSLGLKMVSKFSKKDNLLVRYLNFSYHKTPVGSADDIGNQIEFRWRHQLLPKFRLEFGGAYLFKGEALEQGDYPDDTLYGYTGFQLKF
ncbi:MAG: alginate export family protein [Alteromonadaceae bacterium]|nr:alginate export family protein [Alteromonadaceae bacterium]